MRNTDIQIQVMTECSKNPRKYTIVGVRQSHNYNFKNNFLKIQKYLETQMKCSLCKLQVVRLKTDLRVIWSMNFTARL